jgi:hypothetical protein
MKIRTLGAELFHVNGRTDGRTGKTNLTVDYRKFANAPKNARFSICIQFYQLRFSGFYSRFIYLHTGEICQYRNKRFIMSVGKSCNDSRI